MPPLTTASISLELLQDCLGTLEQLATGITNLGVDATENPTLTRAGVRVLLEELLMSLQQCENDLGIYPPSPFDLWSSSGAIIFTRTRWSSSAMTSETYSMYR